MSIFTTMDPLGRDGQGRTSGASFYDTPTGTTAAAPSASGAADDAFTLVRQMLDTYGLGSLADWAYQQIVSGHSEQQVLYDLRQQEPYKARFRGMALRQQAGLPAISEAEYLSYERAVRQTFVQAGLPPGFYDQPEDFASLIGNDVSVSELQTRVTDGYRQVADAAPEIRAAFANLFGADGDAALAAWFLDGDKAVPVLERAVRVAQASGTGSRYGFGDRTTAEDLAARGLSQGQLEQGFGAAYDLGAYTDEIGGETADLTQKDALGAGFQLDPRATEAFRRRAESRAAAGKNDAGQYAGGQGGISGLR